LYFSSDRGGSQLCESAGVAVFFSAEELHRDETKFSPLLFAMAEFLLFDEFSVQFGAKREMGGGNRAQAPRLLEFS
jgi:hypothetical protein